jgi:hypothetical protein
MFAIDLVFGAAEADETYLGFSGHRWLPATWWTPKNITLDVLMLDQGVAF